MLIQRPNRIQREWTIQFVRRGLFLLLVLAVPNVVLAQLEGWENLGGRIKDPPACVSWGPNRIDCFARGADDAVYHAWLNGLP